MLYLYLYQLVQGGGANLQNLQVITIIAKSSQKLHENHRKGYSNIQKFGKI